MAFSVAILRLSLDLGFGNSKTSIRHAPPSVVHCYASRQLMKSHLGSVTKPSSVIMDSPFPPPVNPHDPGRRYLTLGVTWTLTSIAILAMTARLYLRGRVLHGISADDWLMLLAVVRGTAPMNKFFTPDLSADNI